jgi:hypothetical protein
MPGAFFHECGRQCMFDLQCCSATAALGQLADELQHVIAGRTLYRKCGRQQRNEAHENVATAGEALARSSMNPKRTMPEPRHPFTRNLERETTTCRARFQKISH